MKFDMSGGAAVLEAIGAIARLGLPVRVVGVVGATENLPSARAVKPGDIVRAMDGTTIEVDNTDAEGRLVLADCLLHARALGAERLVDVATLTGGDRHRARLGLRRPDVQRRRLGGAVLARPARTPASWSGGCRCTSSTPRPSRAATPTSPTQSPSARRIRSPARSSCTASPATCRGRTSTSPATTRGTSRARAYGAEGRAPAPATRRTLGRAGASRAARRTRAERLDRCGARPAARRFSCSSSCSPSTRPALGLAVASPGSDLRPSEAHVLLTTESLVSDGDFDLRDEYRDARLARTSTTATLTPNARAVDGRLVGAAGHRLPGAGRARPTRSAGRLASSCCWRRSPRSASRSRPRSAGGSCPDPWATRRGARRRALAAGASLAATTIAPAATVRGADRRRRAARAARARRAARAPGDRAARLLLAPCLARPPAIAAGRGRRGWRSCAGCGRRRRAWTGLVAIE